MSVSKLDKALSAQRNGPLWQGPCGEGPNGGVSFSMLSRWLTCRERFRLYAIEGLRPHGGFNHYIEFGNMWHICEENLAKWGKDWYRRALHALVEYTKQLHQLYILDGEQIEKWYNVILKQFPAYVEYWSKHPDVKGRTPLLQEQTFDVPYKLPSGRVIRLRGKWDSVDLIDGGVWLQENKTKSEIDTIQLQKQLTFDLQTMLYLVTLDHLRDLSVCSDIDDILPEKLTDHPIKGIRYNVIRRHLPIRQHKPTKSNPKGEGKEDFYNRFRIDYLEANPEEWFVRLKVEVKAVDINRFIKTCLDPILENVCSWYEQVIDGDEIYVTPLIPCNWVHPYGIRNMINEGAIGEYDRCIETGSTVGLQKVDTLFRELQ